MGGRKKEEKKKKGRDERRESRTSKVAQQVKMLSGKLIPDFDP